MFEEVLQENAKKLIVAGITSPLIKQTIFKLAIKCIVYLKKGNVLQSKVLASTVKRPSPSDQLDWAGQVW